MKELIFCGTSLFDLQAFPKLARREAGAQLDRVQRGLAPGHWRPMPEIGMGVVEIRIRTDAGAFRVIYLAKLKNKVAVLHCFQKKSQRTASGDLARARERYKLWIKENGDGI